MPAPALPDRHGGVAGAFELGPGEVRVARHPGRGGRVDEALDERIGAVEVGDMDRPSLPVRPVGEMVGVLDPLEVRQALLPRPAVDAPAVVVERMAADPEHRVHGAAAAQHLAAGLEDAAIIEARLRLRVVVPVAFAVELLGERERRQDVQVRRRSAGLDQEHLAIGILAEAGGDGAAGRPGADHDVVEVAHPLWAATITGCGRLGADRVASSLDRARRGVSGALYPQSALAGLMPVRGSRPSGPVRRRRR